jgi:hypothetical protein
MLIGLVSDVISGNRKLIEDVLYRVRTIELELTKPDQELAGIGERRKTDVTR